MTVRDCPGHPDLGAVLGPELLAELRRYAGQTLDLLQPWVDRIREQPPTAAAPADTGGAGSGGPGSAGTGSAGAGVCASCPVCAVLVLLRGGRPELAVRLAEQASGLLAVLRIALDEGLGDPVPASGRAPEPGSGSGPRCDGARATAPRWADQRVVQRITVSRDGGERATRDGGQWGERVDGGVATGPC